jgi:hypothetical protein
MKQRDSNRSNDMSIGSTILKSAVFLVLLGAACAHASGAQTSSSNTAKAHRAQWEAANVTDYTWSIYVGCMCDPGTAIVKVVDSKPVDARENGQTFSIEKDEKFGLIPLTVDELFDQLDQAYSTGADTVDVSFDPTLGFPSELRVDPSRITSDDEIEYRVEGLERAN